MDRPFFNALGDPVQRVVLTHSILNWVMCAIETRGIDPDAVETLMIYRGDSRSIHRIVPTPHGSLQLCVLLQKLANRIEIAGGIDDEHIVVTRFFDDGEGFI